MAQTEPVIEESGSVEDLHRLRLTALLHELVRKEGTRGAARALGIDHRTVASYMEGGRLSWRVREALERGLQSGAGSAAARQRKRNEALEARLGALDERLGSGLEGVRAAVEGEVRSLREAHAGELRRLERRLARVEAERGAQGAPETPAESVERPVSAPPWRPYRGVVTLDPEPGEEQVYGEAAALVVEWRRARGEFLAARGGLPKLTAEERMRVLEIELIEAHALTLPPARYPWDGSDRRREIWSRGQTLRGVRAQRGRAELRRWLRRVLTIGVWRS